MKKSLGRGVGGAEVTAGITGVWERRAIEEIEAKVFPIRPESSEVKRRKISLKEQ